MSSADRPSAPPDERQELYAKLARDAARLMVVHEAGRILRSTHDPERLAGELLQVIADAVFSRTGCVAALKGDQLEILATLGLSDAEASALVSNPAEAAFWFAVADGAEPQRAEQLAARVPIPDPLVRAHPALAVYVPLWLEERVLGVLGLGPRVDGQPFTAADEEFVVSLASHLALALSSAELFTEKERRIQQLNVLLKISKEITSTLDLERVLQTIVHMLSMVVPNRRVSIALTAGTGVTLSASSDPGFDRKSAGGHPLLPLLRWALGAGRKINVSLSALRADEKAEGRELLIGALDASRGPRGVAMVPMEDDQGMLGLLVIECDPDAPPLDRDREELVDILANQTTVAIRNAELYRRVPMIGFLEPMLKKSRPAAGRRRRWIQISVGLLGAVGLLVPLPASIPAGAVVRPSTPIAVRAATGGVVEEVFVTESQSVEAGALVARMRTDELLLKLEQTRAARRRAQVAARAARQRGSLAEYRARQAEWMSHEEEERFLETELRRTELVAPASGVVLTAEVERRKGQRLERGDTFLELADLSTLEIEARVQEQDIRAIHIGAQARVKVYSYPGRTFSGRVVRTAPRAGEDRRFRVSVEIENRDEALRPGMTGHARLQVAARPFLWQFIMPLVRWVRFQLWV